MLEDGQRHAAIDHGFYPASDMSITFGTSGWRGIIARDFTFDNVRLATQAIAEFLSAVQGSRSRVVILGYDTRFLGREFSLPALNPKTPQYLPGSRPRARPPTKLFYAPIVSPPI